MKKLIEIQQHFKYDPESGVIERTTRKNSNGSLDKYGYLIIKFKGKQYKAHRLAWFLHYGVFPSENIDHINRIKTDNMISNLRDVKQVVNIYNTFRKPNKDTGVTGIYLDKSTKGLKKKYCTRVNKKIFRFYDLQSAITFKEKMYEIYSH